MKAICLTGVSFEVELSDLPLIVKARLFWAFIIIAYILFVLVRLNVYSHPAAQMANIIHWTIVFFLLFPTYLSLVWTQYRVVERWGATLAGGARPS